MAERIPQSTTIRVPLQAYLASDHISAATGKTIAITISKNGAAYGNPSAGATNATEIANGSYYVDLSTTDTGTIGPLFVRGSVATVDDVIAIYHVVKATNGGYTALPDAAADAAGGLIISDAGGLDADAQRSDVAAILVDTGTTLDARIPAALVGGRMDASVGAMAANVMTAAAAAADLTTELQSGLATAADLATVAGYLDTEIAAIKAKTDNLPASPAAVGSAMTLTAAYDAAKTAAQAGDAMALTSGERTTLAQAILKLDWTGITGEGSRSMLNALRFMRNKWSIAGGTLTVTKEDDSTAAWTGAVTTTSGDPVSSIDPA